MVQGKTSITPIIGHGPPRDGYFDGTAGLGAIYVDVDAPALYVNISETSVTNWEPTTSSGGPGGGLPTGWTQDESDPANVSTNGGTINPPLPGWEYDENPADGHLVANQFTEFDFAGQHGGIDGLDFVTFAPFGGGFRIEPDGSKINVDTPLDMQGVGIGNFDTLTPASPPEVPATPTAQDIVDALVTLGLITQAAP